LIECNLSEDFAVYDDGWEWMDEGRCLLLCWMMKIDERERERERWKKKM